MMDLSVIQPVPETNDAGERLRSLKGFTAARIALGRTGTSVPLKEALAFRLAHAHARDAVYAALSDALFSGLQSFNLPVLNLNTNAANRQQYLQRPDLGRQLSNDAKEQLQAYASPGFDIVFVIADGLSAPAINQHAVPLLHLLVPRLLAASYSLAPLAIVYQARVAAGDETGELLRAKMTIILIGERPGLSASDSLGVYLTYLPKAGKTDEMRNCVSNIRPAGLPLKAACEKIFYLVTESFRRQLSGVMLKEETGLNNGDNPMLL